MSAFSNFCRIRAIVVLLAVSAATPSARAQDDDDTARARHLFHQGRAALEAHKPEAARIALEISYKLRPTPQVGYNLGLAELETRRFVEAARHISLYVHQAPNATAEERRALSVAESYVGQLMIEVNVDGARVQIDNEILGPTPFVFQPIYVLPGRRAMRATCDGFQEVMQVYDVQAGRRTEIKFVLEPNSSAQVAPAASVASTSPPTRTMPVPPAAASAAVVPVYERTTDSRTIVLAGGITLTVASGILAAVEALRASSAASDVDGIRGRLAGPDACRVTPSSAECLQLVEAESRRGAAIDIGRGALLGTAILGGATAAAWFLWPRSSSVRIVPQVQQSMTGVLVSGSL